MRPATARERQSGAFVDSMINFDRFRFFVPALAGATLRDRVVSSLGAALGIAVTASLCAYFAGDRSSLPMLVAPIGASAVLLFAVPASPLAQPWSIIGGNVVSAFVGVTAARLIDNPVVAAGVAVGGAIFAMSLLRCLHPPGGAAALTAVIGGKAIISAGYLFPLVPVGLDSIVLVTMGWLFHRVSTHTYPHRVPHVEPAQPATDDIGILHPTAIDHALADLGETFDIRREDLDLLLERAEFHERELRRGDSPARPR
ncbi:putative transmembrane protein [Labilithrix luteola]|uniref:Putative transmembrane protein n=1 Tax=Labilithrix luteola TaxID=1391654 RepID=A0A0K1Q633_9BACT|nr:HPP family protein [Labilithrix luteola]AKV01184.1 putative transmembrane protein [Labilithrix luteola]